MVCVNNNNTHLWNPFLLLCYFAIYKRSSGKSVSEAAPRLENLYLMWPYQ